MRELTLKDMNWLTWSLIAIKAYTQQLGYLKSWLKPTSVNI